MQDLKKWFDKAKLPIKIERDSVLANKDIFTMRIGIRGKTNRREYFSLYTGHEENDIRVIDVDSDRQQLLLLVREPPREFFVENFNPTTGKYEKIKRTTPDFMRKYLVGMDEAHLFISELPQEGLINKVKDALKVLKPEYVIKREKDTGRIKRQGEWFFIPVTPEELKLIEKNENFIEKKKGIAPSGFGNPHIADKVLHIKDKTFVKGKIYHVEHKTLNLHGWFSVLENLEVSSVGRIGFID